MSVRPGDSLPEAFERAFDMPYTSEYEIFFLKEMPWHLPISIVQFDISILVKGKSMSDFLSEIQSDELARCEEYQEWLELRRLEAIESMEQEAENDWRI
jgi:hypothetical protein